MYLRREDLESESLECLSRRFTFISNFLASIYVRMFLAGPVSRVGERRPPACIRVGGLGRRPEEDGGRAKKQGEKGGSREREMETEGEV